MRAFAKLPQRFGFAIEYTDSATNLRYYEPDFVAVGYDGTHYLIETKGREDIDVAHKDRAALISRHSKDLTGGPMRLADVLLELPQVSGLRLSETAARAES